jgi:hypothetical protein
LVKDSSEAIHGKDALIDWILDKTDYLNSKWGELLEAENTGYKHDGSSKQSNKIRNIASKAKEAIKKYKNELSDLGLSPHLYQVKTECNKYLDHWNSFFYYMSKYSKSGKLDDLGRATKSYSAADFNLSKILSLLGIKPHKPHETHAYPQAVHQPTVRSEKEIIRIKEVLVKIKCPSCRTLYYETLPKCPCCGKK